MWPEVFIKRNSLFLVRWWKNKQIQLVEEGRLSKLHLLLFLNVAASRVNIAMQYNTSQWRKNIFLQKGPLLQTGSLFLELVISFTSCWSYHFHYHTIGLFPCKCYQDYIYGSKSCFSPPTYTLTAADSKREVLSLCFACLSKFPIFTTFYLNCYSGKYKRVDT